ncbi:cryptochrome/photolyase family protein [Pseudomonas sp. CES]|nr:cryptochrome/photolyase family protein [Pseudomonas sp. CES]
MRIANERRILPPMNPHLLAWRIGVSSARVPLEQASGHADRPNILKFPMLLLRLCKQTVYRCV